MVYIWCVWVYELKLWCMECMSIAGPRNTLCADFVVHGVYEYTWSTQFFAPWDFFFSALVPCSSGDPSRRARCTHTLYVSTVSLSKNVSRRERERERAEEEKENNGGDEDGALGPRDLHLHDLSPHPLPPLRHPLVRALSRSPDPHLSRSMSISISMSIELGWAFFEFFIVMFWLMIRIPLLCLYFA